MITNSSLTIYHKTFDNDTKLEKWVRYNYEKVWFFGGKGASTNKGYENANDVQIRIPYKLNEGLDVENFDIGDIILQGTKNEDINTQKDLKGYLIYNITSIVNNTFGNSKHIHLSGK